MRRVLAAPHGARFRARVFTAGEQATCEARGRTRAQSYAARFAAKEAAMKVLGTGWSDGVGWCDVEVVVDARGRPGLRLHGRAAELAHDLGMDRWLVSLTHTRTAATAWVLAEGKAVSRRAPARRRGSGGGVAGPRPKARRRTR